MNATSGHARILPLHNFCLLQNIQEAFTKPSMKHHLNITEVTSIIKESSEKSGEDTRATNEWIHRTREIHRWPIQVSPRNSSGGNIMELKHVEIDHPQLFFQELSFQEQRLNVFQHLLGHNTQKTF